jgi:pyruvate/2-oxoglutarate dehydrogenase complex dihydrolipoamide dehydrogenase (E3) component
MTARQARAAGIDVATATADISQMARAATDGITAGRLVLSADRKRGVLIGAAAVGPRADDWISEAHGGDPGRRAARGAGRRRAPFPDLRRSL